MLVTIHPYVFFRKILLINRETNCQSVTQAKNKQAETKYVADVGLTSSPARQLSLCYCIHQTVVIVLFSNVPLNRVSTHYPGKADVINLAQLAGKWCRWVH